MEWYMKTRHRLPSMHSSLHPFDSTAEYTIASSNENWNIPLAPGRPNPQQKLRLPLVFTSKQPSHTPMPHDPRPLLEPLQLRQPLRLTALPLWNWTSPNRIAHNLAGLSQTQRDNAAGITTYACTVGLPTIMSTPVLSHPLVLNHIPHSKSTSPKSSICLTARQKTSLKGDPGTLYERVSTQAPIIPSSHSIVTFRSFISRFQTLFTNIPALTHTNRIEIQNSNGLEGHLRYG